MSNRKTRNRKSSHTLTGTRIYVARGHYRYISPEVILNPKTGKIQKSHTLCTLSDGEFKAREALAALLGTLSEPKGNGDFCAWLDKWRTGLLKKRVPPKDPARMPTFLKGKSNIESALSIIEEGLGKFDVAQIRGYDVGQFLDLWEGQRAAQVYRAYLSKFFEWCIHRQGLIDVNPAKQISLEPPQKRKTYITDEQFLKIRDALMIGFDKKPTRTGAMIQCYMDLLYLLFQRGTDIRLMRWDEVKPEGIEIEPTKTAGSSGVKVMIPMGDELRMVFSRIKTISKARSTFIIHTEHGQPYTASGIRSLFSRAAKRAGVEGVTLKDIRAKAASDAAKQGYTTAEIKVALAHTDEATTRDYIRDQAAPVSAVIIKLPKPVKTD